MTRILCAALLIATSAPTLAATDERGSREPLGLERFPRSTIVTYRSEPDAVPRELIVSRVDKTRRDVRAERKLRVPAALESATFRIPDGIAPAEVAAHYRRLLAGGELFSCAGRDCGRSNHWANYIFEEAILYGPDGNQFYLAADYGEHLVGVYVIERGNRRVYAHVLALTPAEPVGGAGNVLLVDRLDAVGHVLVQGVTPRPDGSFSDADARTLAELGASLRPLAGLRVFVVCHLYPRSTAGAGGDRLLAVAATCAERAVALLGTAEGPELVPFGAGPLLPRADLRPRLELVAPARLVR